MESQPSIDGMTVIQEWEGYVVETAGDGFVAQIVDITAGSLHEEAEAIIPLAAISAGDAAALRISRELRWITACDSGTKKCVNHMRFRDRPRITERGFHEGREWARDTRRAFKL